MGRCAPSFPLLVWCSFFFPAVAHHEGQKPMEKATTWGPAHNRPSWGKDWWADTIFRGPYRVVFSAQYRNPGAKNRFALIKRPRNPVSPPRCGPPLGLSKLKGSRNSSCNLPYFPMPKAAPRPFRKGGEIVFTQQPPNPPFTKQMPPLELPITLPRTNNQNPTWGARAAIRGQ